MKRRFLIGALSDVSDTEKGGESLLFLRLFFLESNQWRERSTASFAKKPLCAEGCLFKRKDYVNQREKRITIFYRAGVESLDSEAKMWYNV